MIHTIITFESKKQLKEMISEKEQLHHILYHYIDCLTKENIKSIKSSINRIDLILYQISTTIGIKETYGNIYKKIKVKYEINGSYGFINLNGCLKDNDQSVKECLKNTLNNKKIKLISWMFELE